MHARVMESPVLQARVVYTSVEAIRAWVEFWPDGGPRSYTPISDFETEHSFTLLGLRHDVTYNYRVIVQTTGGSLALETHTFETPAAGGDLTPMAIDGDRADGVGRLLFPLYHPENQITLLYVVDADGYLVWSYPIDGLVLSARPSRDGTGVWAQVTRVTEDATEDTSALEFVSFDGATRITLSAPYTHHDFYEREDGSLVAIVSELREIGRAHV